jgi:hypothetical protein
MDNPARGSDVVACTPGGLMKHEAEATRGVGWGAVAMRGTSWGIGPTCGTTSGFKVPTIEEG